jgi:hypothetical protein
LRFDWGFPSLDAAATKGLQPLDIHHVDASVPHAHVSSVLQLVQRTVRNLTRQTAKPGNFLLRNSQRVGRRRAKRWIEELCDAYSNLSGGGLHAAALYDSDELAEASVQLMHEKVIEIQARIEKPMKRFAGISAIQLSRKAMTS